MGTTLGTETGEATDGTVMMKTKTGGKRGQIVTMTEGKRGGVVDMIGKDKTGMGLEKHDIGATGMPMIEADGAEAAHRDVTKIDQHHNQIFIKFKY